MSRIILFPFSMESSQSDARIQERIEELLPDVDCFRVYPNRNYRPAVTDVIVGWGAGDRPDWHGRVPASTIWLNKPSAVMKCVNKTASFRAFAAAGVRCVPFTTSRTEAGTWAQEGHRVMARNLTEGRDGEGAQVLNTIEEVRDSGAGLFTLFIPKAAEYRVHVFNDEVIGVQQRARRDGATITNHHIRTSGNGWGLTRNWDVTIPTNMRDSARLAVSSLGLQFGAVDIGVDRFGRDFVFEVNSAPEVLGEGVNRYANAIVAQHAA